MTFDREEFEIKKRNKIISARGDRKFLKIINDFVIESDRYDYGYYWTFAGLPIIQMPEDIVTLQEMMWELKPDIVIETGIAWGGGLALYSSFQELYKKGITIGIDVTIPEINRTAIMSIPSAHRIKLFEGSSLDQDIFREIKKIVKKDSQILIVLDSNHVESHVFEELTLWSEIMKQGDVFYVSDTFIENIPEQHHRKRAWSKGNNPHTAVKKFLECNPEFSYFEEFNSKIFASFSPMGVLRKTND